MRGYLLASELMHVLTTQMGQGGDFPIHLWDGDTDTQFEVSSLTFDSNAKQWGVPPDLFINMNETETEISRDPECNLWTHETDDPRRSQR